MTDTSVRGIKIGVINPFALVEIKLRRKVEWDKIANHKAVLSHVLGIAYDKLFDPQFNWPLYNGLHFDVERHELVRDDAIPSAAALVERAFRDQPNAAAQAAGALLGGGGGSGGPSEQWVDPGRFFTNAADFKAPVQGATPDCHFISALASLAWAYPIWIAQRTRPLNLSDAFPSAGAVDIIPFYPEGGASVNIEVTELLPLMEPGNNFIYARSANPGEIWPAVYEKAWVKWFTNYTGDTPDYTKITGGDPISDLTSLTGWPGTYRQTQGQTPDAIWQDVRSNCRGSWTFNPMAAWTYASAADAPTQINYATAGLVAWHVYSILGWIYSNDQQYIVLRNPWGNSPGTLDVDNGPWTSMEQFGPEVTRTLGLPSDGVFALRADIFQQYYAGYGWVTAPQTPAIS